jgi:hypothetical protein
MRPFHGLPAEHPGEKRLVEIAEARCEHRPAQMRQHVEALLAAGAGPAAGLPESVDRLVDGLDALLEAHGLLSAR